MNLTHEKVVSNRLMPYDCLNRVDLLRELGMCSHDFYMALFTLMGECMC